MRQRCGIRLFPSMPPILKCTSLFAHACARKDNLIGRAVESAFLRFDFASSLGERYAHTALGEGPARCKQKRARRAKCTAECRTFRRKNANEQIAPRNWDGSPKPRNTRHQRPAITAFLFRATLVRYAKIKQEI